MGQGTTKNKKITCENSNGVDAKMQEKERQETQHNESLKSKDHFSSASFFYLNATSSFFPLYYFNYFKQKNLCCTFVTPSFASCLLSLYQDHRNLVVLDTRNREEYNNRHIRGSHCVWKNDEEINYLKSDFPQNKLKLFSEFLFFENEIYNEIENFAKKPMSMYIILQSLKLKKCFNKVRAEKEHEKLVKYKSRYDSFHKNLNATFNYEAICKNIESNKSNNNNHSNTDQVFENEKKKKIEKELKIWIKNICQFRIVLIYSEESNLEKDFLFYKFLNLIFESNCQVKHVFILYGGIKSMEKRYKMLLSDSTKSSQSFLEILPPISKKNKFCLFISNSRLLKNNEEETIRNFGIKVIVNLSDKEFTVNKQKGKIKNKNFKIYEKFDFSNFSFNESQIKKVLQIIYYSFESKKPTLLYDNRYESHVFIICVRFLMKLGINLYRSVNYIRLRISPFIALNKDVIQMIEELDGNLDPGKTDKGVNLTDEVYSDQEKIKINRHRENIQRKTVEISDHVQQENFTLNVKQENLKEKVFLNSDIAEHSTMNSLNTYLKKLLESFKEKVNPEEYNTSINALKTIIRNILMHPTEMKYRSLKESNEKFYNQVGKHEELIEILIFAGFLKRGDLYTLIPSAFLQRLRDIQTFLSEN